MPNATDYLFNAEHIDLLRMYVQQHGEVRAAADFGVSRSTIARALAGLHLRPGTRLMLGMRLGELVGGHALPDEVA